MEDINKFSTTEIRHYKDELWDLKWMQEDAEKKIKEARKKKDSFDIEYLTKKIEKYKDRITELERILKPFDNISCVHVKAKNLYFEDIIEYQIIDTSSPLIADSTNNIISDGSPIGRSLKKGKKGEIVTVETPAGLIKYEIINTWTGQVDFR